MKPDDIRAKSEDELRDRVARSEERGVQPAFSAGSGQLENTARVRDVRRDIARVQTVLSERRTAQ